jgi:hypothetical protein
MYGSPGNGRIVVVAAFGVYVAAVALLRRLADFDIWPRLGVPTGPSDFFDARNVMAALECRRLGFDPLIENPCDPWGRPIVYPRPWLLLRFLGLDQSDTTVFALVAIALFVAAFVWILGPVTTGEGIVAALALCSPAVMLAIERANMDIVVFVLLALAIGAWASSSRLGRMSSPVVMLLAALAKVYPIFGLGGYLASRKRKPMLIALGCAGAFLFWVAVTRDDIRALADRAPQGEFYSYGARILLSRGFRVLTPEGWEGSQFATQLVAAAIVASLGLFAWFWVRRRVLIEGGDLAGTTLALYVGSLVYIGTFVIGNNFDYRLVFVLLTLPQLFAWTKNRDEPRNLLASAALISVVMLLWIGAISPYVAALDEVVSWATAALLFSLVAASAPSPSAIGRQLVGGDKRARAGAQ